MSRRRASAKNLVSKEIKREIKEEEEEEEGEGEMDTIKLGTRATRNMKTKLESFSFGTNPTPSSSKATIVSSTTTTTTTTAKSKKRKRSESPPVDLHLLTDADADADADAYEPTPQRKTKATKAAKAKVYKMELDSPQPAPANWLVTYRAIEEMRKGRPAPVDTMGCHAPMKETRIDVQARRFITLVSLMLSSQTKDEVTHAAVQNLRAVFRPPKEHDTDPHKEYLTVPNVLSASIETIESCINKVGFWRRKAQYLKATAEILQRDYAGEIPKSVEGLCGLPGVGMKMAMLTMQNAWGENVGIGVDVHVHRITNRLGWFGRGKETKTPEETRVRLESWLPREFYGPINPLLVGFGQTVCTPVRPKCEECLLSRKEFEIEWEGEGGEGAEGGEGVKKVGNGPLCPSAFKGSTGGPRRKVVLKKEEEVLEALIKVELEE
ncbi:DNA N-glycosylase and apurinic/apyrimidinic (AP) lyase [Serendipita sp. 405]|nr:DNA N-glycosylase and apurinic/apyrimidinic (AP) lyase [Serendipita sp. 405]